MGKLWAVPASAPAEAAFLRLYAGDRAIPLFPKGFAAADYESIDIGRGNLYD